MAGQIETEVNSGTLQTNLDVGLNTQTVTSQYQHQNLRAGMDSLQLRSSLANNRLDATLVGAIDAIGRLPEQFSKHLQEITDQFRKDNPDKAITDDNGVILKEFLEQISLAAAYRTESNEIADLKKARFQSDLDAAGKSGVYETEGAKAARRKLAEEEATYQSNKSALTSALSLAEEDIRKAKETNNDEERKAAEKEYDEIALKLLDIEGEHKKANDKRNSQIELAKATFKLLTDMSKEIYNQLVTISTQRGQILTRLNGAEFDYENVISRVALDFSASLIVDQKKLMENITKYANEGYAYNLEQRAFLNTIKDDIATTFDAFDKTLLRLERIQQQDFSVARLGAEAALTEYLNRTYLDSSYMNQLYDTVAGHLLEAESTMTKLAAAEFEYTVQKWLGSMYSVGVSDTVIGNIALALGKLGSGDIKGLSGSAAQSLLALGANYSGNDYAEMLVNGLDASNVNTLLESIVGYLQSMTSDNNVITSALGNVFGLTTSSMMALQNLNAAGIAGEGAYSYSDLQGVTSDMYNTIWERIGYSGMLLKVLSNFKYGMAATLSSSPIMSGIYQLLYGVADSGLLDFALPSISVAGFGASFEGAGVSDIVKAALGGWGILSGIITAGHSIYNQLSGNAEDRWLGEAAAIESVGGKGFTASGELQTTSQRTVMNTASTDLTKGASSTALGDAEKTQGVEAQQAPQYDTEDIYNKVDDIFQYLFVDKHVVYVEVRNGEHLASTIKNKVVGESFTIEDLLMGKNENSLLVAMDTKLAAIAAKPF